MHGDEGRDVPEVVVDCHPGHCIVLELLFHTEDRSLAVEVVHNRCEGLLADVDAELALDEDLVGVKAFGVEGGLSFLNSMYAAANHEFGLVFALNEGQDAVDIVGNDIPAFDEALLLLLALCLFFGILHFLPADSQLFKRSLIY